MSQGFKARGPWLKRIVWLLSLWLGGVVAVTLVAWLIRVFMNWAGFST